MWSQSFENFQGFFFRKEKIWQKDQIRKSYLIVGFLLPIAIIVFCLLVFKTDIFLYTTMEEIKPSSSLSFDKNLYRYIPLEICIKAIAVIFTIITTFKSLDRGSENKW